MTFRLLLLNGSLRGPEGNTARLLERAAVPKIIRNGAPLEDPYAPQHRHLIRQEIVDTPPEGGWPAPIKADDINLLSWTPLP